MMQAHVTRSGADIDRFQAGTAAILGDDCENLEPVTRDPARTLGRPPFLHTVQVAGLR